MNAAISVPIRGAVASLLVVGPLVACGGCRRTREASPVPECAPTAQGSPASVAMQRPEVDSATLAALCRRASHRVQGQLDAYRGRFLHAGLAPPERVALEVCPAQSTAGVCPQRQVVARYVARRLVAELGRVSGLDVLPAAGDGVADGTTLAVDATTDFAVPFDAIDCSFALCLPESSPVTWGDRFSDHGLVFVDGAPPDDRLLVNVVGQSLRLDFSASSKQWVVLPRGQYSVSIRSRAGAWSPGSVSIGSQAVWDVSLEPVAPARGSAPVHAVAALSRVLPPEDLPRRVCVLSPSENARVPRIITVSGIAPGLEGAMLSCTVSVGSETYRQDGGAWVRSDRSWEIPNVVVGRVGSADVGTTFHIGVQACVPGDDRIESELLTVERR